MRVLGISAYFHDAAAALVDGAQIVAAAQEERFSRTKHDAALPVRAIEFCLRQAGLGPSDLDAVVFYEKPLSKFERILVTHLRELPFGAGQFTRALGTWLSDRLWLRDEIVAAVGCPRERVLFSEHHLSHAASAFFCSPFASAAIVTVDGVGEWATTSIFHGRGTEIELLGELHYPHSIGLLYSALTAYLGFEVNEGEYKVMGLAAYGRPRFLDALASTVRLGPGGELTVDRRFYCWSRSASAGFTSRLEQLLGPARVPGSRLELPALDGSEAQRFADVAASLQALTERYLLELLQEAKRRTGEENLALAGGVALNAVANRALLEQGPFCGLFVQPAAGDAGGALGAALWASHTLGGAPRGPMLQSALLGAAQPPEEVARWLEDCAIPHRRFADRGELFAVVARKLAAGEVGAISRGRFEWGPRALGARSILADPRGPGTRDRVNRKIKLREPFRPFAPAVLAGEAERWFSPVADKTDHTTPFMCSVAPATPLARAELPAVVHVDGTARLQTVTPEGSPDLAALLEAFRAETGLGVLLNTSLNLKDEPITASAAEAYSVFARSELDFLVAEDCLVERSAR
jgi:carbamoyltransferase